MRNRTDLAWSGGDADIICDIELLNLNDHSVFFVNYEHDTEEAHEELGGKNYYRSCSGLSGAGYAFLPPSAFFVSSYRTDLAWKPITRVPAQELLPGIFLHIYYPSAGHSSLENEKDHKIYFVLQDGYKKAVGTQDLQQALFVCRGWSAGDTLHAILKTTLNLALSGESVSFLPLVERIAQEAGMEKQEFSQRWVSNPYDESWLVKEISYPVYHAPGKDKRVSRLDVLHFLDTRFMRPVYFDISPLHSMFPVHRIFRKGRKPVYAVLSPDKRILYAFPEDPFVHGFGQDPIPMFSTNEHYCPEVTDPIAPVERYWDNKSFFPLTSGVSVLVKKRKDMCYCVAIKPAEERDLKIDPNLRVSLGGVNAGEKLFWEYEIEVPTVLYGFDSLAIAESLRKAVLLKRRKALLYRLDPGYEERRKAKGMKKFVEKHSDYIVTIEDSLAAGNCRLGTEHFRDQYFPGRENVTLQELSKYASQHAVTMVIRHIMAKRGFCNGN